MYKNMYKNKKVKIVDYSIRENEHGYGVLTTISYKYYGKIRKLVNTSVLFADKIKNYFTPFECKLVYNGVDFDIADVKELN